MQFTDAFFTKGFSGGTFSSNSNPNKPRDITVWFDQFADIMLRSFNAEWILKIATENYPPLPHSIWYLSHAALRRYGFSFSVSINLDSWVQQADLLSTFLSV
jgi:hypothetical protein